VDRLLSLLHSISSRLSDKELSAMKFLCLNIVKKGKLATVQSARDLFNILMELQEITNDNLNFLKQLLQHIDRKDLLALVVQFEEEEPLGPDNQPDEHEKAVNVICKNVGRDWKRLMRELGMSEAKLDRIEAAHRYNLYEELCQGLREWQRGKGKDAKVADLIRALRGCHLNLVADLVEE
ncbi:FADD protein, partial [Sylvietta virens]|nr:FADD protein [Sylvietta virens]